MTVESSNSKAGPFNVTGTSGTFPRDFLILNPAHLKVIRVRAGIEEVLTSGITMTGVGTPTGNVVVTAGLMAGDKVYLQRAVPNLQLSDYSSQGRARADQVESDFDLQQMQIQDLFEAQSRALTLGVSAELSGEEAMQAAINAPQYAVMAQEAALQAQATANSVAPSYASLGDMAAAVQSGTLPQGKVVMLHGVAYTIDSTATGIESALYGLGINGIRGTGDTPLNFYIAPGFKTQRNNKQFLYVSPDGRRWNRLNNAPMFRGAGDATIGSRDAQLFWCRETAEWIMGVTAGVDLPNKDYSVWRSKDLVTWRLQDCVVGPTGPIKGTTLPGAAVVTTKVWGPRFWYDMTGQMWGMVSVEYGPRYTNAFDVNAICMRPHMFRVTNPVTMASEAPVMLPIRTGVDPMIGPDFFHENGTWYCAIKNSMLRNIEIYSATNFPLGPWTYHTTLDQDGDPTMATVDSIEGPTWCIRRYYRASDNALLQKYCLHISDNRDADDMLVELPKFYESTAPTHGYNLEPQLLEFSNATRNYAVNNVMLEPDPRALKTVKAAIAAYSGEKRDWIDEVEELSATVQDFYPQHDFLYFIGGNGNVATLRFKAKSADRFWLAVFSNDYGTGIRITGNAFGTIQHFGFGQNNFDIIEMRWAENGGGYRPARGNFKRRFKARMNANQVVAGTATLNFDNELYDIGNCFAGGAWVPGRGIVSMQANVTLTGSAAGENYTLAITADGSSIAETRLNGITGGSLSMSVAATARPESGTAYEVRLTTSASRTVSSTNTVTWFEGWQV